MVNRLLPLICALALVAAVDAQTCVPPVRFPQTAKAPIRQITFLNDGALPQQEEQAIAETIRDQTAAPNSIDKDLSSIANEGAENVRAAFQDRGYFKVEVSARALRVVADPLQYDVELEVRSVGRQYRLGDLNVIRAAWFPAAQLRDLFPIQRGEIFSREKIIQGLDAVRRLYGSQGFINYTGVPETQFDDDRETANLTINVDEGKQFRLRDFEVLGVDPETKSRVLDELPLKPGDIFSPEVWEQSLLTFPNAVHNSDPNSVNKRLDEKNGWVDMVIDARKPPICPTITPATKRQ